MSNINYTGIIWAVIVIVIIIVIIFFLYYFNRRRPIPLASSRRQGNDSSQLGSTNNQNIGTVTEDQLEVCVDVNGLNVRNKFYYPQSDLTIESLNVDDVPNPDSVCLQYCQQLSDDLTTCVQQDDEYNNCINLLTDGMANRPVSVISNVSYYGIGKGRVGCYPTLQTIT